MAHRELYRNSTVAFALISMLLITACNQNMSVPGVYANTKDAVRKTGTLYVAGNPYSGWLFELNDNTDTLALTPFINGKEYGEARQWWPNRQLREVRYYKEGKKVGTHTGWWPNGQKKFEYHFVDDEFEGTVTDWFENGQVYRIYHYSKGHENGNQRRYYEDGRIQANYEVRNGRNYGNIGFKNCQSPYEKDTVALFH